MEAKVNWGKVIAQYEAIRRLGQVNMFDKTMVQRIAFENDYHELVLAIEDGHYTKILTNYGELMKLVTENDIPEVHPVKCNWGI